MTNYANKLQKMPNDFSKLMDRKTSCHYCYVNVKKLKYFLKKNRETIDTHRFLCSFLPKGYVDSSERSLYNTTARRRRGDSFMRRVFNLQKLLNNKDFIYALTLIIVIGTISCLFYELTKVEVTVVQEDEQMTIRTHAKTVEDVLNELAIDVHQYDDLSHELDELVTRDMKIEHTIAKKVIVMEDEQETTYYTTAETVADFLEKEAIALSEHDSISHNKEEAIKDNLNIHIDKAFEVTINDAGKKETIWTTGGTIAELLANNDVELTELDRVEPSKDKEVSESLEIDVTRVEKVTDIVEEEVDFAIVKKSDASIKKGTEEVVTKGEKGTIEKHYEVVLENGKEVSRELLKEETVKAAKEQVVAVGTKEESKPVVTTTVAKAATTTEDVQTLASRGTEEDGVTTLYMHATAYNWDCASCDGRGLTSTGYDLKANPNGVVSVDPNVIPLGTKVWIEGYGYAIARDTGGNIKGNRIDVHLPTIQQARDYGSKTVKVKIYK